jgi:predicted small lipoprotein YifL
MVKQVFAAILVSALVIGLAGCGSGDVDPNQKVDAPGYYNGPMKGKAESADTKENKSKAAPE